MKLPRRNFLHLAAGAAALPAMSRLAWAQSYPSRTVRIVVGFPAGQAIDISARLMANGCAAARSVIHRREPAGRRRQYRYRDGRALSGRRIHAADHFVEQRDQHHAL